MMYAQFEPYKDILGLIVRPQAYNGDHEKPYNYRLEQGNKVLVYIGSKYPTDLSDSTFDDIEKAIAEMLEQQENQNICILIGNAKPMSADVRVEHEQQLLNEDMVQLVKRGADIAYLTRRAVELDIPLQPLEPADSTVFEYFEQQGYSKQDIFLFIFMKNLINYQQRGNFKDFNSYKKRLLESIQQRTGWEDFDYSEKNLVKQINRVYGKNFSLQELLDDPQLKTLGFPNTKPYFMDEPSKVNQLRNLSWAFRDRYAVQIIAESLQDNNRVLVLYGSSHAFVQRPALEKLFSYNS